MARLTISLSEPLKARLEARAAEQDMPVSHAVCQALTLWLDSVPQPQPASPCRLVRGCGAARLPGSPGPRARAVASDGRRTGGDQRSTLPSTTACVVGALVEGHHGLRVMAPSGQIFASESGVRSVPVPAASLGAGVQASAGTGSGLRSDPRPSAHRAPVDPSGMPGRLLRPTCSAPGRWCFVPVCWSRPGFPGRPCAVAGPGRVRALPSSRCASVGASFRHRISVPSRSAAVSTSILLWTRMAPCIGRVVEKIGVVAGLAQGGPTPPSHRTGDGRRRKANYGDHGFNVTIQAGGLPCRVESGG